MFQVSVSFWKIRISDPSDLIPLTPKSARSVSLQNHVVLLLRHSSNIYLDTLIYNRMFIDLSIKPRFRLRDCVVDRCEE